MYGSINKYHMKIGGYYGILLSDGEGDDPVEWLFRFVGLEESSGWIMSDITYYMESLGWYCLGDNIGILCYDNEIVKGSIRKYTEEEFREKLNLR